MSLLESVFETAARAGDAAKRHPRRVTAAVIALLGGFAATAFGIAPMAPDAADLPKHIITESIAPEGIQTQLDALAEMQLELSRNDLTRASDTADSLLKRLGVADAAAAAFIRHDPVARGLLQGTAGKMVQVHTHADGTLLSLVARYPAQRAEQAGTHFTRLTLQPGGDHALWQAQVETVALQSEVKLGTGTVGNSLFTATDDARIPDKVANQLADMFATDIDFHRQLRKGAHFSVVYEALTADGEPITWDQGAGQVLAAEFSNNGRTYQAVWYRDASGQGGYYGMDGQSKRKSFLASPVDFSRVTSGFAMRMHPISNEWKKHMGVDYGAPIGTAVHSVGDGVVDFAGVQNGYGNVIVIQHSNDRSTLYAHLSHIDVRKGQHVTEAQRIGAVGMTGWATGPHLHFEFRVHGVHQDPLTVAKSTETISVPSASRDQFLALARNARSELAVASSMSGARGTNE